MNDVEGNHDIPPLRNLSRSRREICLTMSLEEFERQKSEFLVIFAKIVGCAPDDIEIVEVRKLNKDDESPIEGDS